ncbi:hypothetical protein HN587_07795 [Candidatus Woesearchaeota archaeon]|jgi:hypothetical protein|nr:hypothetical protein [Candidatus Woesearchaeota archaeon]
MKFNNNKNEKMVLKKSLNRSKVYGKNSFGFSFLINKKAAGPFISWVLVMAFAVALSAFMYSFMVDHTTESTNEIKKTVFNTDECRQVSLSVESVCQNLTTQVLNIQIQNRNYRRIDLIDYRIYDADKKPLSTNSTEISLNPDRTKQIEVTGITQELGMVEVIPIVKREDFTIICADRKASSTIIEDCNT